MTQKGGDWKITVVTGVAFLLTMLWVGTIRIQFSDGRLSYYTLFTGTRSIALSDIESTETKLISRGRGSRVLLIHPRQQQEKAQKPITVKIKLFSRGDVGRLFDLFGPKFKGSRQIGVYTDESV